MQTQNELQNIKAFVLDTEARVDASGGMPHEFTDKVEAMANLIRQMGDPEEQPNIFQRQLADLKQMSTDLWEFSANNTHLTPSMKEHIQAVHSKIEEIESPTTH